MLFALNRNIYPYFRRKLLKNTNVIPDTPENRQSFSYYLSSDEYLIIVGRIFNYRGTNINYRRTKNKYRGTIFIFRPTIFIFRRTTINIRPTINKYSSDEN